MVLCSALLSSLLHCQVSIYDFTLHTGKVFVSGKFCIRQHTRETHTIHVGMSPVSYLSDDRVDSLRENRWNKSYDSPYMN